MNRRTALLSSLFLGGLVPTSLRAQESRRRSSDRLPARTTSNNESEAPEGDVPDNLPPGLRVPGFQLRRWDIARYTRIPTNVQAPPEKALIDWILLRTGTAPWHGDHVTILSANRKELVAYNSPEVLRQVDQICERFINAVDDTLKVQVQFIAAVDPRWRYTVYPRLTYVGGGPQGQQIWTMDSRDTALVIAQMEVQQGFRRLAKEGVEMINGQTLSMKTREPRTFVGRLAPDPGGGIAFQPKSERIEEGVFLKLSPLLNFDGTAVDAKIDLSVNMVRTLHRTKVIAPRGEIGSIETTVDVPDATETHLEQTVRNWRLNQSLIISCGIHPGLLDKKSGLFNLPIPGTYPTATEILVFLEVVADNRGGRMARVRGRAGTRAAIRDEDDDTASVDRDQP